MTTTSTTGRLAACALALGCSPEPPAPAETPTATPAATKSEAAPAPKPAPATEAEPSAPAADDCVTQCVDQRRMEAVAAEVIEAKCRAACADPAPAPEADAACVAAATAARKKIEAVPMPKRAPRVFAALADPAVSCGSTDPVLAALAEAGHPADRDAREAALAAALRADPKFTSLCPAGTRVLDEVAGQPADDRVAWLLAECPIDDEHAGEALYRDLGPMTYLAIETIARRWQDAGATTSTHAIMLDILRLSSGLEGEAARRRHRP
jgi:hypothetical protein